VGVGSFWSVVCALGMLLVSGSVLGQTNIQVPNASFESPETVFADPQVDDWEKTAQPFWWDEQNGPWTQLTGVFLNTTNGSPDHIGNMDGNQALFLFALPTVGLFQDYDSIGGTNTVPSNAFNATYQAGKSYRLTVGVIGGGGGMTEGAALGVGLYYRDVLSNRVSVAMTNIAFTPSGFPDTTNFIDFSVTTPPVKPGDDWAGEKIGVQLLSAVGFEYISGGYWDLDHVRLTEFVAPRLADPAWMDGQFGFTLLSDPGLAFEVLTSTNASQSISSWTLLGTVTNVTGSLPVVDAAAGAVEQFYAVRQLP